MHPEQTRGRTETSLRSVFLKTALPAVLLIVHLLLGNGCRARTPVALETDPSPLERLAPTAYPAFCDDLAYDGLAHALSQSLVYLERLAPHQTFAYGPDNVSRDHMRQALVTFQEFIRTQPSCAALQAYIHDNYAVYQPSAQSSGRSVKFTGYYEPLLSGSREPGPVYRHALYGRPCDLITLNLQDFKPEGPSERLAGRLEGQTLKPYPTRRAIEAGALPPCTPVLAWVDDPIALFFLHIQGSGRISLDDGTILSVGYDSANGQPYRSIGRLLIDEGHIAPEAMSMQQIKAYLQAHPHDQRRVLQHNPSYIFFRRTDDGPFGNINVKLTPGRSLALDYRLFPAGALVYIQAEIPVLDGHNAIASWQPLQRFALHQDTGGAIRGLRRADLFLGSGTYAEIAAGHLQHDGRIYFLIQKH